MRIEGIVRSSYREGWTTITTIKQPNIVVSTQLTGWVGDAHFAHPHEIPLGAELQLLRPDTGETIWLGKIVERRKRTTDAAHTYKARGICEFFLDLPFPLKAIDYNRARTGNAQSIWEYHLAKHLRFHTPRFNPVYNLNLNSLNTRDIALSVVRDAYKLYSLLRPCKITPALRNDHRINMILEDLPLGESYPLPRDAPYEIAESILETANRISLANPARQILKDRRIADPNFWELTVPTGATANITVQDPNEYGYLGAYATRIDYTAPTNSWIALRYKETIKAPKDAQGNRLTLVVGMRERGDNAQLRVRLGNAVSTPVYMSPSTIETSFLILPAQDELTLSIELASVNPFLNAHAVIDALYCIPANEPLNERDYQPHLHITDQIVSYITGGIVTQIHDLYDWGGGVYDLISRWGPFPSTIQPNTPVQILQNSRLLPGYVVARQNTEVLRVQLDTTQPNRGDTLYIAHNPISDDAAHSEMRYDTLYTTVDAPVAPNLLGDHLAALAEPRTTLTAQIPLSDTDPLPKIGQTVRHPNTNAPLPIYEVELAIMDGKLHTAQIRAGSPDLTMRALLRRLNPSRTRQL